MPAVQPARLRQQVSHLVAQFEQPTLFKKALHDLYFFYSDHSYRPGQESAVVSLLPGYRISLPVQRQVEQSLLPLISEQPQAALELADHLWADSYLEIRLLAVFILSHMPIHPPEGVLARLSSWITPGLDRQLLDMLLRDGSRPFRQAYPDLLIALLDRWLGSLVTGEIQLGLYAVQALAADPEFKNLPVLLRLVSQVVSKSPAALLPDLQATISALAERSPAEIAHFLRQMIAVERTPIVARLTRRCLPFFELPAQDNLRAALREADL